ncbi:MAG: xylulokinase [Firmicutes bacterium ZCTH02-B6]|nr:MAG: xylulokinase [Firmicutes bacterium ZCTH02-B6]
MPYLLGIDVGTSGTKTLLAQDDGRVVASATVDHPLHALKPGWAEQDAADWWNAAVTGIRRVLSEAGVRPEAIAGIGVTGQMHSSVLLDAQGQVIRPPILWCDVRTAAECREIEAAAGGRSRLIELTGNPALEGFTAPKLIWLRNHERQNFARIRTVMLPKDYIRWRLTGEIATDVSDAAGTLLFDVRARQWSGPVVESLGLDPSWLPPVFESADVVSTVTGAAAEETGLKAGTPVVAGGADNTCGAIGAGVVKPGQALVSIGSSGVVFVPTAKPQLHPAGIVHTFVHSVPGTWYVMGVTLAAGLSLRWLRDELARVEQLAAELAGTSAYDLLAAEAQQAPPGSAGLFFLPYLSGERTPHADANARGVWFGLSTSHKRAHLIRSVFEGITYSLRDALDAIRAMDVQVGEARLVGGGAKSDFWHQLTADILNVRIGRTERDEGPAFGALLLAGVGSGVYRDIFEAVQQTVRLRDAAEPDQEAARGYDERFRFYQSLYPALKQPFADLVRWQA